MVISKQIKCVMVMMGLCLQGIVSAQEEVDPIVALQQNIQKACPKQWEGLFSDIKLKPGVLDIWQGDLTDRALFVQYANEFLLDENGGLLIDNYNDVVTIMTECGAQRVTYYKTIRQQIGESVGGLVSDLTGQSAFSRTSIATGVDYSDWVEGTTTEEYEQITPPINLAIGRNTTQSGTSSDELSDTETERSEDEYADLAHGQGYAIKAVDNDTDGDFAHDSVTHTGFQDQPYWEVDLDTLSRIDSITLYNRTDCCQERLSNLSILLGTRPIDARKLVDAKALQGVTEIIKGVSITADSHTFLLQPDSKARYVRIQLGGDNTVLSLAEVKIMGNAIDKAL